MHTARGKAHSALQRQKLIAEQNTKRATLSPPPRTLYVCVCVCPRGRSRGGSTGANLHYTPICTKVL